jgi:hypothetical protein
MDSESGLSCCAHRAVLDDVDVVDAACVWRRSLALMVRLGRGLGDRRHPILGCGR